MITGKEPRTALYRFYDADARLLYVGVTDDPWRRWREHVREKPWYPRVKHQTVTWYDTRTVAEAAEKMAIRCEHPRFNVAGVVRSVTEEAPAQPAPQAAPEPAFVAEPEPEPMPEAAEPPGPVRGRRTLAAILACTAWAFLPSMPGMPSWRNPWVTALVISTVIPVMAVFLIAAAPRIHRFGRWLDRTFTPSGAGL